MRTMADVKAANAAIGHHFFDASALSFFHSRIESRLIGGRYFITSEQNVNADGSSAPRRYTVRMAMPDGSIANASHFQEFETDEQARHAAECLARRDAYEAQQAALPNHLRDLPHHT
jgi:hypothetical protein